jgi:histidine triad (HIT) family protein
VNESYCLVQPAGCLIRDQAGALTLAMPDESPRLAGACTFCRRDLTQEYLLHEGDDFYVIADYAPVAAAHILLIPREHYPHLAALPPALEPEFHELKARIGGFVREEYGSVTCWENGVFGQSVPHAHLHTLSVEVDTDLISRYGAPFATLSDLRSHHAGDASHYFRVEHAGVGRVLPPDPQLYWAVISDAKLRNGGSWQYTAAERRVHGRPQVEALIRRWRERFGTATQAANGSNET